MRYLPLLLALLLAAPAWGQSRWPASKVSYSDADTVEGERDVHRDYAHASLPTCDTAAEGTTAYINDGAGANDCSDGGSTWVLCGCTPLGWEAVGGGGGAHHTEEEIKGFIFDGDSANVLGNWLFQGNPRIADNIAFNLGTGFDWKFQYDEVGDDQLLWTTVHTQAIDPGDPMLQVLVDFSTVDGTNLLANQQVFGIARGTQDDNVDLLTLDAEGDLVIPGLFTAGSLAAADGTLEVTSDIDMGISGQIKGFFGLWTIGGSGADAGVFQGAKGRFPTYEGTGSLNFNFDTLGNDTGTLGVLFRTGASPGTTVFGFQQNGLVKHVVGLDLDTCATAGTWYYDDVDNRFEFCNVGSGTPVAIGDATVPIKTITGTSATLESGDSVVLVDDDTAGSTVTITLPAAASNTGRPYHIKKLGTTANVVVDGNASETIDGATTLTLTIQYESIQIVCDGSNWSII